MFFCCSILQLSCFLQLLLLPAEANLTAGLQKKSLSLVSSSFHSDENDAAVTAQEDQQPIPPLLSVPDTGAEPYNITRNFISATLGDNMVLQRNKPAVVWGYSQPGATVEATLLLPRVVVMNGNNKAKEEEFLTMAHRTTQAQRDGTWRITFPSQPASLTPQVIEIKANTGQTGRLTNVLFGDVYLCGGQSNMEFPLPRNINGTQEAEKGDQYPHIRIFTVGKGTRSTTPLPDLQTIEQRWSVAKNQTLNHPNKGGWGDFSAVCWFFGKHVSDGLDNQIPIGLISNNWGGTEVELWQPQGDLFNAMIYPYMVGPMSLTGFIWYQGEANTKDQASADAYAQNFPTMIEEWRLGFGVPQAYFGFVQLSTWCPSNPVAVAELRQAQMKALGLPGKIGYSTNADHGLGCNVHPTDKRFCSARLGNSALALQYGQHISWRSPTYSKASAAFAVKGANASSSTGPYVVIHLQDVSEQGLYLLDNPYNNRLDPAQFNCSVQKVGTCAGPMILMNGEAGWVDATVELQEGDSRSTIIMRPIATKSINDDTMILATSYGWGAVPMMTIYDKGTDLPVLGWSEKV